MRRKRKTSVKSVPTFAFVVDGNTEIWYLQMLKRNEQDQRNVQIKIKPEIPQKKNIKEQYVSVKTLAAQEFTNVFWILDLDTVLKESKETPKNKKAPLQVLKECKKECEQKYKHVIIITINPCLEFWFLLHFVQTSKPFNNCTDAENELKKYLPDYQKSAKYFLRQNEDIYLRMKPFLKSGIKNSEALGKFDHQNPEKTLCEMYLLFRTLAIP